MSDSTRSRSTTCSTSRRASSSCPERAPVYIDAKLSVIRQRAVATGFHEELTILNHADKPVSLYGPDRRGLRLRRPVRGEGRACRRRVSYSAKVERTERSPSATTAGRSPGRLPSPRPSAARVRLRRASRSPSRFRRTASGRPESTSSRRCWARVRPRSSRQDPGASRHGCAATWSAGSTRRRASSATGSRSRRRIGEAWSTSRRCASRRRSPAAVAFPRPGCPWFMTMFGRDSIFTSLQALPFTPELAATTLRALGDWQGVRLDDFRDEDPGRILHEMRYGEMTAFEERPHSPYYGCGRRDAALRRPARRVRALDRRPRRSSASSRSRRAPRSTGSTSTPTSRATGYISYQRRNEETGLENQCWKDSWDSISYRDGWLPGFPRATCELQGLRVRREGARRAARARDLEGRRRSPTQLEREAADLKRRFNRDFWVEDGEYFALALDADGQAGRRARVEQRPPALERHRRQVEGEGRSRATCSGRGSSRAGACARWPRARAATTRSGTTSARSGRSTTRSSRGACAAYGFKDEAARDRRRHPRRRRVLRRAPARGVRRLRARSRRSTRCSTRPRAARRRGRRERRCSAPADDARARAARRAPRRRSGAPARRSATSSCSTSPAAGVGSMRLGRGRVSTGSRRRR